MTDFKDIKSSHNLSDNVIVGETTSSPVTYEVLGSFMFDGTDKSSLSSVGAVAERNNANQTYSIRIYDVTNALVIAEVTALATAGGLKVFTDLGVISNLPTGQAEFEIQARRDAVGASTQVTVHLVKFTL